MAGPNSRPERGGSDGSFNSESASKFFYDRAAELLGIEAGPDRGVVEASIAALLEDNSDIAQIIHEELIARRDHAMAIAAQEGMQHDPASEMPNNIPAGPGLQPQAELALLAKLAGLHVSEAAARSLMPNDILDTETEAGGQGPLRATHNCTACMEPKSWIEIYTAPCAHEYCAGCLQTLFQDSYKDESLFPPRCCKQTIPFGDKMLTLFLPESILANYPTRKIEMDTTDRTYCHQCSSFIRPDSVRGNVARCGTCTESTCSKCKKEYHFNDCVPDEAEQQTLELAKREGWQRCPGCRSVVALNIGCNHMT